jgi:hypothetical protein
MTVAVRERRTHSPSVPRFDDRLKASLAIVSNGLLVLVVIVIAGLEELFGRQQTPTLALLAFVLLELVLIVYFGALAASDRFQDLLRLLARAARTGVGVGGGAEQGSTGEERSTSRASVARRVLTNLWVPVTLNFLMVGYLIYASGGLANSAYSQVPIAMMLIGQSVYDVPAAIELSAGCGAPRVLVFVWRVAGLYAYPLCLMAFLLACLLLLQRYAPLVSTPVPAVETGLTTLVMLLASMCVTFITRKADRVSALR